MNYVDKKTQWKHLKYKAAFEMLEECNDIKYAAYRTAAKLSIVQRTLGLEHVRLAIIDGVFQHHHIQVTENGLVLECSELEAILYDIFFAASKEDVRHQIQVELCTEVTLNFLLSVFDRNTQKKVQVLGAKIALVCLCSSRLQEKYQYFFSQLADHNNCLSRRKLHALLTNIVLITDYLSESLAFSSELIPATIDSCFQQSHGPVGMSEDAFMNWLLREPQLLVWLSTFYRLRAAEKVSHGIRCSVCRTYPIMGLRYSCLKCLNYDQCQTCFFHGRLSKRHKLKHPMQEYCWETTTGQATVAFLKAFVNRLCGNTSKLQYLPVQPVKNHEHESTYGEKSTTLTSSIDSSSSSVSSSADYPLMPRIHPQHELHSIIGHLERQLECLQEDQDQGNEDIKLQQHRLMLETQVYRLKQLKLHLQSLTKHEGLVCLQSTPVINSVKHQLPVFQELSPIYRDISLTITPTVDECGGVPFLSDITPGALSTWIGGGNTNTASNFTNWLENTNNLCEIKCIAEEKVGNFYSPKENSNNRNITDSEKVVLDVKQKFVPGGNNNFEKNLDIQMDLDRILDKLQNMLTSNFSLEDDENNQARNSES